MASPWGAGVNAARLSLLMDCMTVTRAGFLIPAFPPKTCRGVSSRPGLFIESISAASATSLTTSPSLRIVSSKSVLPSLSNMRRKGFELSELRSERPKMSSVAEMSALAHEAADHTSTSANWKDRVSAAARVLKLPFGRTKRFYYRLARRVDAEEMDRARAAVEELREVERQREAAAHLLWLESELGRLRAAGEDFHGPHVDALEHFLRRSRNLVGLRETAVSDRDDHLETGGVE